ncbi:FAD-binding oxidoreductase [Ornithinimicrobium tianjinense]|uniref:Glycolate oxidase n=1 Tax=Ornithinimicrobium tianjinense TaxID=1195761 RepID=A0A917F3J8_9MICO|nr:FAD-binding oxidoreductase [Ornithinimicrobium tianjinense]GGF49596.1 glycolate oxidase [Ornithinimicrobium tianjinense]
MTGSVLDLIGAACQAREATAADAVDGVTTQVVASPASTEETSALLRACHEHGLAVVVRGHGTKLAWGTPPERVDVVLDTTRMDALVEHSRGDLIATAGAGMPLARLAAHLAEGGHQLVVDDLVAVDRPDGPGGSTLGGAVATNLSGPRRTWVGAMRDLVIGVRFVRPDGTVAKAGGKVVKNVAGYDLSKLLCGSYGSLAVITEVTVRLHPLPEADRWVGTSVEPDRLAAVLAEVVQSQEVPHAVEVRVRPGVRPAVVTLLSGTEAGATARAETLRDRLATLGCEARVHDVAPPWWGVLLHPGQRGGTPVPDGSRPVLLKATARLSGIPQLLEEVTAVQGTATGSAGSGVLYVTLPPGDEVHDHVQRLRSVSTRLGGSLVVLDAPPQTKPGLDSWGAVPGLELMRRVKQEFDPRRTLAPGRFVGGL